MKLKLAVNELEELEQAYGPAVAVDVLDQVARHLLRNAPSAWRLCTLYPAIICDVNSAHPAQALTTVETLMAVVAHDWFWAMKDEVSLSLRVLAIDAQ